MKTLILRRTGLALAVAATALSVNAAIPATGPVGAPAAEAACKKTTIGGKRKCIGRGQFCAIRHQSDYRRNGFRCAPDSKGRNRLRSAR
ncbi:MAG: hypothetical protein ITG02_00810 [Patulibacter sp.]|nr:hypothetical protein [Patulibacter sp.]